MRDEPPGDYQVVLLLLAAQIGFPNQVGGLFDRVLVSAPDKDLWLLVAAEANPSTSAEPASWSPLAQALLAMRPLSLAGFSIEHRPCIPRVAGYSFQTLHVTV